MIKLFNQSIGPLRLKKIRSLIQASLVVGTLVAVLSFAGEALGQAVAPSNPFVILLDGYWVPAGDGVHLQVTIYDIDSGSPGPTDKVVGTAYAFGPDDLIAYDLGKGTLTAQFVGMDIVITHPDDGSETWTGTWELNILEATGIYNSFVGGHIHMVDVLKFNSDGTILEHCFCHISRKHGKP